MPVSPGRPELSAPASAWRWVPTLYLVQGLPYAAVMSLAVVMYKNLGVSNTEIALYTSWLYLPWVIKPLWSPLVELFGSARGWVLAMQFVCGLALAMVGLSLPGPWMLGASLAVFWLLAFASATHDIAADGFYLQALPPRQQAAFVGVRSTAYRVAMIGSQGGLVVLAGWWQEHHGDAATAWAAVFALLGAMLLLFAAFHAWALPRGDEAAAQRPRPSGRAAWRAAMAIVGDFFRRPGLARILAFLLLYRFAEAQLLKLVVPFLLDPPAQGGLGLSTQAVGLVYGTVGVLALTVGGLLGGWLIARHGLVRCLWPLVCCLNLPNLVYVALAWWQPGSLVLVSAAIGVEQFGYGLGFAAYLVFMLRMADGPHPIAHFAIGTGFMALGMMLPGMAAGWLQAQLGYLGFFGWVCLACLPSFLAVAALRLDASERPSPPAP